MAARLGVSAKALRVYEREGLISPGRTEAGWRVYGPAQAARLHQIMALRGLGLSLKRIKALLVDDQASLADILALQRDSLAAQRGKLDAAIGLLGLALQALEAGRDLTLDDLTQLTQETVMDQPTPMLALRARVDALIAERLPGTDIKALTRPFEDKVERSGRSRAELFDEMRRLVAEGKALMGDNADDSEAAKAFVRRWRAAFADLRGDADVQSNLDVGVMRDALVEAMHEPAIAERLPFDPAVFDFLRRVAKGMKDRGEI
jgi:DNA-binding transcriptional MerR regulator